MDRWSTVSNARTSTLPGEFQLTTIEGVRLDDGDKKTQFSNGDLCLTSHRLIWTNQSILASDLVLPLHLGQTLKYILMLQKKLETFLLGQKVV